MTIFICDTFIYDQDGRAVHHMTPDLQDEFSKVSEAGIFTVHHITNKPALDEAIEVAIAERQAAREAESKTKVLHLTVV